MKERVYREIDVGIFTVAIISGGEGGAGVCAGLFVENQTIRRFSGRRFLWLKKGELAG